MPDTMVALVPILQFLASAAGAGIVASRLLDAMRRWFPPLPTGKVRSLPAWQACAYALLYTPSRTRLVVFGLTALVSLASSAAVAAATGQPVNAALDAALAIIIGQLRHGWTDLPAAAVVAPDRRADGA